jgi:glycosyltransferase involved in cell wall biosynthesis
MLKTANLKFNEKKINITVLSTGNIIGEFGDELIKNDYKIFHIPFRKDFVFVFQMYRFLKKCDFDVVHIHTERFFFFYILIAKFARVNKVVRTIHSTFEFKGWLSVRRKMMLKFGSFLGCTYISISKNVQDNEQNLNKISTKLINNWIDTDYFKFKDDYQESPHTFKKKLNIISVGACSHVKQHFYIFELILNLKKKGWCVNYLHIGSGELEEKEKIIVSEMKISDSVKFLGLQNNIIKYLQKSDYFIMPSAYEGLGNACLEAMSSGVIPIVNDVPGLRDLVKNEISGLVVNFANIEQVSERLTDLHQDKDRLSILKMNARQDVVNLYSLSNIDKLINIYKL